MDVSELMTDALGRVRELVHSAVEGLSDDDLAWRPDPEANSIAWLVWHLTRIEDDHVADVADTGQAWVDDGWADRFGLPLPLGDHGYGHSPGQVGEVRASADLLAGYYDAVSARTATYLAGVGTRRPRRRGGRALGPAGDARGAAGERRQRGQPACRPGGVRAWPARAPLTAEPPDRPRADPPTRGLLCGVWSV